MHCCQSGSSMCVLHDDPLHPDSGHWMCMVHSTQWTVNPPPLQEKGCSRILAKLQRHSVHLCCCKSHAAADKTHTWIRSENAAGPPCGRNTSSQPENPIRPTSFLNQTNNDKTQQTCKPDKTVSVRVPKLWGVYYAQVSAHLSTAASGCRIKP